MQAPDQVGGVNLFRAIVNIVSLVVQVNNVISRMSYDKIILEFSNKLNANKDKLLELCRPGNQRPFENALEQLCQHTIECKLLRRAAEVCCDKL